MPKSNIHHHLPLISLCELNPNIQPCVATRGSCTAGILPASSLRRRCTAGILPASSLRRRPSAFTILSAVLQLVIRFSSLIRHSGFVIRHFNPTRPALYYCCVILTLLLPTLTYASGSYSGGDGQPATPFQIAEPNDLIEMSQHSEDWNKNFILTNDINLNLAEPNTFTTALIAPDTSSTSWYQGTPFTGSFDGQSHTIHNLTIDTAGADIDYLSLFGQLGSSAVIQNLDLQNARITGGNGSYFLSSLVGSNGDVDEYTPGGNITNCSATGSVVGGDVSQYLGILVGYNVEGTISNCHATGSVTAGESWNLGGLVGQNYGTITNCYATGSVTSGADSRHLGGLVGRSGGYFDVLGSTIINCYAVVSVTGGNNSERIGGLVGYNDFGTISNCHATENITSMDVSYYLGGLVGYNESGSISNCYATGNVTDPNDSDKLGGLVGYNDNGVITYCYATGAVTGDDLLGGLSGSNGGTITNCYATGSVTGTSDSGSLGGLVGSSGDSIINCYATGNVTGDNYLGGLVGNNGGVITNCHATGAVTGGDTSHYLGGLLGANPGTVYNCYAIGNVTGGDNSLHLGGLVGSNGYIYYDNGGTITNCYATGSVASGVDSEYLGGLLGLNVNNGTISMCYSSGSVNAGTGSTKLAGFCGYQSGNNAEISNSFWNTVSSGMSVGYNLDTTHPGTITNVLGKTTSEMQIQTTFTDYNWDFVNEATNGLRDIWRMGFLPPRYPILSWQYLYGDFDFDRDVDLVDLCFFLTHWPDSPCDDSAGDQTDWCYGTDLNKSGQVDGFDYDILAYNYLKVSRVFDPTLIVHWKLDESSGIIANDSSGNDYNADLINDPNWQPTAGQIDGAIELDGADQYIDAPYVLNPTDGSFTACVWIKGGQPNEKIICQTDGSGIGRNWLQTTSTGYLTTNLKISTGSFLVSTYSGHTDGYWHHVALVWDGARRHLYADGVEVAADSSDLGGPLESCDGRLYIGTHKSLTAGMFWTGFIDDVRIYNRALTQPQIQQLANLPN